MLGWDAAVMEIVSPSQLKTRRDPENVNFFYTEVFE